MREKGREREKVRKWKVNEFNKCVGQMPWFICKGRGRLYSKGKKREHVKTINALKSWCDASWKGRQGKRRLGDAA